PLQHQPADIGGWDLQVSGSVVYVEPVRHAGLRRSGVAEVPAPTLASGVAPALAGDGTRS
ncbi:MAG TPA: hypothetical protein VMU63_09395, partial [Acidimicrobiales bacterium]|nr:hypothetical protein [Acidimicrobiales bacterium]